MVSKWNYSNEQLLADFEQDIAEFREEFSQVDIGNPASLRQWFKHHPYLKSNEHALIAGVALDTIGRWKRMAGLTKPKESIPFPTKISSAPSILVTTNWATKEWLENNITLYGVRQIAKAAGCSRSRVRELLRRFIIPIPKMRSQHACRNENWLREYVIRRRWSFEKCAKEAGVSKQTISRWLAGFGIHLQASRACQTLVTVTPLDQEDLQDESQE
jgi:transcriptional regulator with XRE-family HTH domain